MKILIIGAGFSGAVIARQLAEAGHSVDVIEERPHIAGNAYDYDNELGIRVHKYGPHIFHTSNLKVVKWLSQFTNWIDYKHKVKAILSDGRYVTLPVNKETTDIVGKDKVIDTFIRPYTKKMWGLSIEQIDSSILNRIPIRDDFNEFYFPNDTFQAMPEHGYTKLFESILDHPKIKISLNKKFKKVMEKSYAHIFNSMSIDEYFDFQYGELDYRSIKFHTYTLPMPKILPVATVNFTNDSPFTRVTEWKNFPGHGENLNYSTITFEQPCDYLDNNSERYYPVKDISGKNIEIYEKYKLITPKNVTFIGRCGLYAYLDMHQAVSSALAIATKFTKENYSKG